MLRTMYNTTNVMKTLSRFLISSSEKNIICLLFKVAINRFTIVQFVVHAFFNTILLIGEVFSSNLVI